jgi:hypothetical protein
MMARTAVDTGNDMRRILRKKRPPSFCEGETPWYVSLSSGRRTSYTGQKRLALLGMAVPFSHFATACLDMPSPFAGASCEICLSCRSRFMFFSCLHFFLLWNKYGYIIGRPF